MIGVMEISAEPGCRYVSPRDVRAAMVRLIYGVEVVQMIRWMPQCVSYYSPGLRRPLIWSSGVH